MSWHYRAAREVFGEEEMFTVRDFHSTKGKSGYSATPQFASGETLEELAADLERMAAEIRKNPVIEAGPRVGYVGSHIKHVEQLVPLPPGSIVNETSINGKPSRHVWTKTVSGAWYCVCDLNIDWSEEEIIEDTVDQGSRLLLLWLPPVEVDNNG